ncbi:MAG: hypothetical protein PF481_02085 [Bacteroidales bacterium]|jgi:hypothetical protein|nr:hypothetical protein [Bacteroidales bacterium]
MRKKLFRTARFLAVSGVLISFMSCNSGTNKSQDAESAIDLQMKQKIVEDVKMVMISLPSPVETAMLLKRAGATYNEALLNPISNAKKYNTDKQKALNLGVYGANLSYASIFEQDAIVMQYMNVSKKLAIGLDLLTAIDQSIVDRLEANHDDRDSVVRIISETFLNSNSTLKEDNRPETAALILAGGWIEGLYLATSLADSVGQKSMITRIVEQKLSFNELIQLLETYSDNKDVADILESISPVKAAFDNVEIKKEKVEVVTDVETKKTDFKSVQKINISQAQYDELKSAALELRNSIIQ